MIPCIDPRNRCYLSITSSLFLTLYKGRGKPLSAAWHGLHNAQSRTKSIRPS